MLWNCKCDANEASSRLVLSGAPEEVAGTERCMGRLAKARGYEDSLAGLEIETTNHKRMRPQLWSFTEELASGWTKCVQVTCIKASKIDLWLNHVFAHHARQHLGVTNESIIWGNGLLTA
jgi:hypothetical protein